MDEHTLWPLHLVPAEDVVFLPAWALGAPQAADQENCHPGSYDQCQKASTRQEPMNQISHTAFILGNVL